MRIVVFVEGWTEKELPAFLKRWLDPQLPQPIGIKPVRFEGEGQYRQKAAKRAELYLAEAETVAVFGLLDLYGLKEVVTTPPPPPSASPPRSTPSPPPPASRRL